MRHRESQYVPKDYLCPNQPEPQQTPSSSSSDDPSYAPLDEGCRTKMSMWSSQILLHCGFKQNTSVIAMNMLDRFLSVTPWARQDRSAFQLASIASLYTAVKIHEPSAIAVETMAELTRGSYTTSQIEQMERMMLEANKWLVHPPTAYDYCHLFCDIIAITNPKSYDAATLEELAKLQLDASVHNYGIGLMPPSEVAFAAIMNAAEGIALSSPDQLPLLSLQQDIEELLSSVSMIDASSTSVLAIENILYEGIATSQQNKDANPTMSSKSYHCVERPSSPRSVHKI